MARFAITRAHLSPLNKHGTDLFNALVHTCQCARRPRNSWYLQVPDHGNKFYQGLRIASHCTNGRTRALILLNLPLAGANCPALNDSTASVHPMVVAHGMRHCAISSRSLRSKLCRTADAIRCMQRCWAASVTLALSAAGSSSSTSGITSWYMRTDDLQLFRKRARSIPGR